MENMILGVITKWNLLYRSALYIFFFIHPDVQVLYSM